MTMTIIKIGTEIRKEFQAKDAEHIIIGNSNINSIRNNFSCPANE